MQLELTIVKVKWLVLACFYIQATSKLFFCFTDLNPCLDVHCPSFGVCKTFSAHEARCVCYEDCPSYHDPVCTANGTTYDNKCWHELYYCRGLENNLVYHPGSCEGREGFLLSWTMYMCVPIWFRRKRIVIYASTCGSIFCSLKLLGNFPWMGLPRSETKIFKANCITQEHSLAM